MNKKRKIYTSDETKYDITIIELEQKDNIQSNNLLELDFVLFEEENFSYKYKNLSIYIIHYPKGREGEYSIGVVKSIVQNNSQIHHLCSTEDGSSGGPIFNLQTFNIIGMHQGKRNNFNFNIGVLLKIPIQEYYQKYKNDLNQINDKDNNDTKIIKFEKEENITKSKHDSQGKYVEKSIGDKKKEKYKNYGKEDSMITKIDEEKAIIIEIMENYICKISYKSNNKNIEDIGFLVSIAFSDYSIKGLLTKYHMDEKSLNELNKIVIFSNKALYELNFNNRFFFSDSFLSITFIEIDNLKFDYVDIPNNNNFIGNPLLIKYSEESFSFNYVETKILGKWGIYILYEKEKDYYDCDSLSSKLALLTDYVLIGIHKQNDYRYNTAINADIIVKAINLYISSNKLNNLKYVEEETTPLNKNEIQELNSHGLKFTTVPNILISLPFEFVTPIWFYRTRHAW